MVKNNDIEMDSTSNEEKSVLAERFIRTLKKQFISIWASKNVYTDQLYDKVNKYNKTYRTITMKPVDVKGNAYIDSSKQVNIKDPKFKVGDHVRISEYKNIFAKGYPSNWSGEVFVIKKFKSTVPWTCY